MAPSEQQSSVSLNEVSKSFNNNKVVSDVSFSVFPGEILGLIGPNGAGKTTTIRMIMDIIKADSGTISVLGEALCEEAKNHIGYLPEERGLYGKLSLIKSITYLASLKGLERAEARARAEALLQRVGLAQHANKKVAELSRGMSQMAQFLVTIIHRPALMIFDEPFSNLDPVNTELLKEMIDEMRSEGASIILSTHNMNEVEELCDRVFMIHHGRSVLYGRLDEIKARYRSNTIALGYEGELGAIDGASVTSRGEGMADLLLQEGASPQQVLEELVRRGKAITRFEVVTPPLHDIFLRIVGETD